MSRHNSRPARITFSKRNVCLLLVAALAILVAFLPCVLTEHRTPDFCELLARAQLAKLPESVKNLKVDTRSVMSKGRPVPYLRYLFVKFQADPNDINNFTANSPSIDKNSFSELIPLPNNHAPTWWPMDQSTSGRMYTSLEQKGIHGGSVFVYDDSNTVRIVVCYIANPRIRDSQKLLEDFKDNSEDFIEEVYQEGKDLLFGD
ncbi:MAG: hypothetical protein JSW59_06760 [Phycisphaerales bacterium]|nr:MAG: hypothetical protein JSW59_06760 [Phycisphaerales bacterium]